MKPVCYLQFCIYNNRIN